MLTLHDAGLNRDGQPVLQGIHAQAAPGSLTALLGPNGAGKSSLLALLSGELAPDQGACHFGGEPIAGLNANRLARYRAALAQESSLDFDFSVRELARLGGTPFPEIPAAVLESLIDSVLQLVDVTALAPRRYLSLSGGERQRAQLARVLVQACLAASHGPALLLLDEPTASLDPRHQHLLLAGLRELSHKLPLITLVSLHDINLARNYADQAWLLCQGRLVSSGLPGECLNSTTLATVFELPAREVEGQILFGLPPVRQA
ncbi:ATP-binding cassette domain-containing protein [Chitinimonas sp. BJYL2]|uniref:ATP-binding cassette domain-containing protein n=1 Tax=Chitinimonas sp. BJYL2 TaxID=2976696 RepID=UPI0022B35B14|nr:ATP-binding cassette domain-containing protein [Chitinimonas sp. BJYL2]